MKGDEDPGTHFLPVEKASPEIIARQAGLLSENPALPPVLDGVQSFAFILNRQRQAVYVNKPFADFLSEHGVTDFIGKRQGELFGCSHAGEGNGCGTTEACARCGAALAVAGALEGGEKAEECRILSVKAGEELDLRVSAKPFSFGGEEFLLVSLLDISADKRRRALERLFFHDVINTAGGVNGLLEVMLGSLDDHQAVKSYLPTASRASEKLLAQILSQKDLSAAENGELHAKAEEVDAGSFLSEMSELFVAHDAAHGRVIRLGGTCAGLKFSTDRTLLARVIGNMVKNALEAERAGAVITLSCSGLPGGGVSFSVRNPTPMSEDARLQVFQRSFSTKGEGRGLGTYSIRLFTEKYMGGKVYCETDAGGTVFRAEYPASL
ncbi:MAG: HAMP domain-containing sensor histidine kinase [Elusimicrobiales bacterium]|nr:HAMP domain-containing sensor histidine kinase [Elusimicrobiales bacterium]